MHRQVIYTVIKVETREDRTMKTTSQHHTKIKLMARNPIRRKVEEVHPEDEFDARTAIPMFMGPDQEYYTVPGQTAAMVWDEWIAQRS